MILYNVTIILEESAEAEWLSWMQQKHIADVMETNCFTSNKVFKVLESPNEGVTYSVQYFAEDLKSYQTYRDNFAPEMQAHLQTAFANRYVAFRTIMELIDFK